MIDVLTNFPTSWDQFVDKLTTLDELDTTKFFLNAAQLKENLIIG